MSSIEAVIAERNVSWVSEITTSGRGHLVLTINGEGDSATEREASIAAREFHILADICAAGFAAWRGADAGQIVAMGTN